MKHVHSNKSGQTVLEIERDRLHTALSHLQRSNQELHEALAESGPDREYKVAIEENIVVIAKYRARIAALDEEIRRLKGDMDTNAMEEAEVRVPVCDSAEGEAGAGPGSQQPQQQQQQHAGGTAVRSSAINHSAPLNGSLPAHDQQHSPSAAAAVAGEGGGGSASQEHPSQPMDAEQSAGAAGVWL